MSTKGKRNQLSTPIGSRGILKRASFFLGIFSLLTFLFGSTLTLAKGSRSKVIDFEDELIEGVNKRPLDYLSQISEKDGRKNKLHLYQKRRGFKTETRELLHELRLVQ